MERWELGDVGPVAREMQFAPDPKSRSTQGLGEGQGGRRERQRGPVGWVPAHPAPSR